MYNNNNGKTSKIDQNVQVERVLFSFLFKCIGLLIINCCLYRVYTAKIIKLATGTSYNCIVQFLLTMYCTVSFLSSICTPDKVKLLKSSPIKLSFPKRSNPVTTDGHHLGGHN